MAVIVVGGQSRKVGKSAIVAGLIRALAERRWTAIKISGHAHDAAQGRVLISHETNGDGHVDTARFLQAGAERVYWVRGGAGGLEQAMPGIRQIIAESADTIVESNSVMRFLDPDLYLLVLDFAVKDFKDSARAFLSRASAFVVNAAEGINAAQQSPVSEPGVAGAAEATALALPERPIFAIHPPEYVNPELLAFVRERLARIQADSTKN
jgi:hypothetical protein